MGIAPSTLRSVPSAKVIIVWPSMLITASFSGFGVPFYDLFSLVG